MELLTAAEVAQYQEDYTVGTRYLSISKRDMIVMRNLFGRLDCPPCATETQYDMFLTLAELSNA